MFDNTIGIIILVLAAILYLIAFYYSKHDKIKSAVLLVVLAGFIIRCFVASDPYLHPWDERYHALVAKNIISEPLKPTLYEDPVLPYNYKQWHKNHIWVHKQPMPLWMMAASMNVFGVNELPCDCQVYYCQH
jgi:4-amino-4-deoxy-L-arabinose transferase-like glycosyltransferase